MLSNITALSKYAGCPHNSSDLTTPVPIFIQVRPVSSTGLFSAVADLGHVFTIRSGHVAHQCLTCVLWEMQVMIQLQPGAPPITCIMNTFPAICAYIKNGYWCDAPRRPIPTALKRIPLLS